MKSGTKYPIVVIPYNDVGDGKQSDLVIVETPEQYGMISFEKSDVSVKQSAGILKLKILRGEMNRGRVVVPWFTESSSNALQNMKGVEMFRDGEEESHIEVELPQQAQDEDSASFIIKLHDPTGAAKLGETPTCTVNVVFDVKSGIVGFTSKAAIKVKQSANNLSIPVARSGSKQGKIAFLGLFLVS